MNSTKKKAEKASNYTMIYTKKKIEYKQKRIEEDIRYKIED